MKLSNWWSAFQKHSVKNGCSKFHSLKPRFPHSQTFSDQNIPWVRWSAHCSDPLSTWAWTARMRSSCGTQSAATRWWSLARATAPIAAWPRNSSERSTSRQRWSSWTSGMMATRSRRFLARWRARGPFHVASSMASSWVAAPTWSGYTNRAYCRSIFSEKWADLWSSICSNKDSSLGHIKYKVLLLINWSQALSHLKNCFIEENDLNAATKEMQTGGGNTEQPFICSIWCLTCSWQGSQLSEGGEWAIKERVLSVALLNALSFHLLPAVVFHCSPPSRAPFSTPPSPCNPFACGEVECNVMRSRLGALKFQDPIEQFSKGMHDSEIHTYFS